MKNRSFVFGAIILGVSGVVCKILGAVYKIPLANILGTQGMGIYYLIFPVYAFLLSITSVSFTTVMSKKISLAFSHGDKFEVKKIFECGLIFLVFVGVFVGLLLCLFSKFVSRLQGVENAYICYLVVAPAIVSVCVQSAFRGLFQGLRDMVPTAVSQIVAQLIKLALGFLFAGLLCKKGIVYGALGAIVGLSLSEIVSLLFFVFYFVVFRIKNKDFFCYKKGYNKLGVIKDIVKESFPFMLSSVILPMSLVIDSFLIVNTLKYLGFEKNFATSLLGVNSGIVNTLVSLPGAVCSGLAVAIVPYITFALNKNDYVNICEKVKLSIKLTVFLCVPCVIFFGVFSKEILGLLFFNSFGGEYSLGLATTLLSVSCINVLYLSLLQISTSVLQALNRSFVPVLSLSVALIFKVIVEVFLVLSPYVNISGAVISNSVCYIVSVFINFVFVKKEIGVRLSVYELAVCPVLCSGVVCGLAFCLMKLFCGFGGVVCLGLSFLFALVVYVVLVFMLKGLSFGEIGVVFNKRKRVLIKKND